MTVIFSMNPEEKDKQDFENFLRKRLNAKDKPSPQYQSHPEKQIQEWETDSKITFSFKKDKTDPTPDIDTAKEFQEYLKAFPSARLQIQHPGTSEEFMEVVQMLRSIGMLKNSIGLNNLISAIIDERALGNLEFSQLEKDEEAAFKEIKPDLNPHDDPKPSSKSPTSIFDTDPEEDKDNIENFLPFESDSDADSDPNPHDDTPKKPRQTNWPPKPKPR